MCLTLNIIFCLCIIYFMTVTATSNLPILPFLSRTTTQVTSFFRGLVMVTSTLSMLILFNLFLLWWKCMTMEKSGTEGLVTMPVLFLIFIGKLVLLKVDLVHNLRCILFILMSGKHPVLQLNIFAIMLLLQMIFPISPGYTL